MPKYIKSHSNYVLKSKHQDIKDGTIYERDITTIGGVNQFAPGQVPVYRSNNFIITIRNDGRPTNQYNLNKWKENDISGVVWTLESTSGITSNVDFDDDTKIVLKQDYYDFSDFAYYGSLTELFRASITDIISRFPGELYITNHNVYYTISETIDFEPSVSSYILGGENLYEVSNPFVIDIHTTVKDSIENPLKFFANEGYTNYQIIYDGNISPIDTWEVEVTNEHAKKGEQAFVVRINEDIVIYGYIGDGCEVVYLSENSGVHIRPNKEYLDEFYNDCDNFERLLVNPDTNYEATFSVIQDDDYGYYRELKTFKFPKGDGDYNIDATDYGFNSYTQELASIGEYYDERFTDNIWRSMTHESIKNFDWTYSREYQEGDEEEYIFGGQKIQKALRIFGREFDETLSYINNIKTVNKITYDERSNLPDYFLTDAVENVGWDVKLIYPYTLNEYYIDNNGNVINVDTSAYTEGNVDCMGQLDNAIKVSGETLVETYYVHREFSQNVNATVTPYASNVLGDLNEGYFVSCSFVDSKSLDGGIYKYKPASDKMFNGNSVWYDESALGGDGAMKSKIKSYTNENTWTHQKCNIEFLRRLKINSPYIWRNKGTVEGIEMILGMFGLRSKKWLDRKKEESYKYRHSDIMPDFDITEYTSFAHRIEECWDAVHQDYRINWVNSTKLISYDNRTVSNYNPNGFDMSGSIPYQGIPVSYRDEYINKDTENYAYIKKASLEDQLENGVSGTSISGDCFIREDGSPVVRRYLYPNFDKNEQLDGNPYYQMNGGWLSKIIKSSGDTKYNFQYDSDDNIVYSTYVASGTSTNDNYPLYKETVRNIKRIDNLTALFSIPYNELYNGMIVSVTNIEKNIIIVDGAIYPIQTEYYTTTNESGETVTTIVKYITLSKYEGFIKVGIDKYFDESMVVYGPDGNEVIYDINDRSDGYTVKAYLKKDGENEWSFICKENTESYYSITSYYIPDNMWEDGMYTNYFKLGNIGYAYELDDTNNDGWKRLSLYDYDYLKINTNINYNKGNNPHSGEMNYDNGHEYFTYFKRLFKYSLDNNLFDERCYDTFNDLNMEDYYVDEVMKYGFSGLIENDESIMQYDNMLVEDSKIHYFGNYKTKKGEPKSDGYINIDKIWIYGQNKERVENFRITYSDEIDNVENDISGYTLSANTENGWIEDINPYFEKSNDEVTNQIVNNKRLLINFNLHYKWYTKSGQEEIKYLDDIVMNYLTQMIPSSTILQIQYTSKNE